MKNTLFEAGSLTSLETRSAFAGESLYALLKQNDNVKKTAKVFNAALESHTFSNKEQRVLLSCLRLLPAAESVALEAFDDVDIGSGDDGGLTEKISQTLGAIAEASTKKIVQVGQAVKTGLQDFYDARLNWYGALDKEIAKIQTKAGILDGGEFANKAMISELNGKKANKTYPTPLHRVPVAQQEAMKALMTADLIKNQCAAVAKAVVAGAGAQDRAIDELLNTIRSTARQQGDECHWTWSSFSADIVATIPRGASSQNVTPADFSVKSIKVIPAENPCTSEALRRATPEDVGTAQRHAEAAQRTVQNAIGKNNVDVWRAISNLHVDEEGEEPDQNKINGVTALIIFADKIHEAIAKTAQQSYFESVYTLVKWIDLSIKDMSREQSRLPQ